MTIVVLIKVNDGIVLASDSLTTIILRKKLMEKKYILMDIKMLTKFSI